MEKEISSGTMLGIVLIALAAVIGLGFMVFSIAKGVANEGVVNVQDNLGSVSESAFSDFDQKIVTGTQVTSAYKTFQGKPVAILINTQAMDKGVAYHPVHVEEGMVILDYSGSNYVNYNAILDFEEDDAGIALSSGVFQYKGAFKVDAGSGKVLFDSNIVGMSKAGNSEYISSNAKFDANLIKDASGQIVGVVFTQLAQ